MSQHKNERIGDVLAETHRLARSSLVDYSFYQIITDPTDEVVLARRPYPMIAPRGVLANGFDPSRAPPMVRR